MLKTRIELWSGSVHHNQGGLEMRASLQGLPAGSLIAPAKTSTNEFFVVLPIDEFISLVKTIVSAFIKFTS